MLGRTPPVVAENEFDGGRVVEETGLASKNLCFRRSFFDGLKVLDLLCFLRSVSFSVVGSLKPDFRQVCGSFELALRSKMRKWLESLDSRLRANRRQ